MADANDNVPEDELDLAEELAELLSDGDFFGVDPEELNTLIDDTAELYADDFED
jgi:hypothetical protein